ncbi:uncharacterized protein LOC116255926 [Nymphaea colorata]|nr:uncharacterized protein LOC116255926 [Nymphaea colorata]XP_031487886.1 uncharacterized protein LOC116255926 [Nymphaea colorata]
MGLNLFEQNDDVEDISKIKVSKEFACKYDYNKRREDLQRLEELKKKGLAGDSSGSEGSSDAETEDDEGLLLPKNDLKFYEALVKVKRNDPSLLQKDVNLFPSDNEDEDDKHEGKKAKEPKKKPLYLKDVVAKHLVENGPEIREDLHRLPPKTYSEELEEYRQAVLDATEDAVDEDGDFFKEKKVKKEAYIDGNNEMSKILGECFEPDESAFWRDYLGKKKWICEGDKETLLEEDVGLSEDEKALEEQDRYESEFNFRHEEAPTDQVLGFSRHIEGTVRKKESARKMQRIRKKERLAQAEFERKEELKRLKNIKKQELFEKLDKIRSVAGIADEKDCGLTEKDLEGEFDPDEFDRKMNEMFDDEYYQAEDADADFHSDGIDDLEKPNFEKEDELLGLSKGLDEPVPSEGFLAARMKVLKCKEGKHAEATESDMEAIGDDDDVEEHYEGKKKKKVKFSLADKVSLEKELDEYYKLDYEDTIGDLKTRFKYREVLSNRYGLSTAEVLMADDKDLNQYVSLKKLAPYRPDEFKIPKHKRYNYKQKILLSIEEGSKDKGSKIKKKSEADQHEQDGGCSKIKKKSKADQHEQDGGSVSQSLEENPQEEPSNGEDPQLSSRAKRRRRQAKLKISQSRLQAYGQIPPKSKKPRKH